jgi:hypothetical protein
MIKDAFFTILTPDPEGRTRATVKKSVSEQIATLRDYNQCSPALRNLLDLIEDQMLVVDPKKRASSHELVQLLDAMLARAGDNRDYLIKTNNPQPIGNQNWRKRVLEDPSASSDTYESSPKRLRLLSSSTSPTNIGIPKDVSL